MRLGLGLATGLALSLAAAPVAAEPPVEIAVETTETARLGTPPQRRPMARPDLEYPEAGAETPGHAHPAEITRGPETNLPMPRYVSLKATNGNVRRGPSLTHRIDWVFVRRDMPLIVTAEHGHWRRVADRDGAGGWVHYSLLSGNRTVIVERSEVDLHQRPVPEAPVTARLEKGVVARLGKCDPEWCRLSAGGFRGWARKEGLWGVKPDEIRD